MYHCTKCGSSLCSNDCDYEQGLSEDSVIEVFEPIGDYVRPESVATCGTCGRSWDDDYATATTPTPSGRCPFEWEHA